MDPVQEEALESAAAQYNASKLAYKPFSTSYKKAQLAYLFAEGVGVHGSFNISGSVALHEHAPLNLWASAFGDTQANRMTSASEKITFFASATLYKNGVEISRQGFSLSNDDAHVLPPDKEFVGNINIALPEPTDMTPLHMKIIGGYFFKGQGGIVAPLPSTVDNEIIIEVIEKN